MEFYDSNILANACWGSKEIGNTKWDNSKKPVASFGDPAWDEKFHVLRMDWDEKAVALSVDGLTFNTIDLTQTINPEGREPQNPFHQSHFLLLNRAIEGDSGGNPSNTLFMPLYKIDYVRVYQKQRLIFSRASGRPRVGCLHREYVAAVQLFIVIGKPAARRAGTNDRVTWRCCQRKD